MEPSTILQFSDPNVLLVTAIVFGVVAFGSFVWSILGNTRTGEAFGFSIFIIFIALVLDGYANSEINAVERDACHAAGGVILTDPTQKRVCVASSNFINLDLEER